MKLWRSSLCLLFFSFVCLPLFAATWYVRPDGGTRYSSLARRGQCDGTADAPYPGSGTNRHCAFKDVRSFWQDGAQGTGPGLPGWGWVGKGGDTYLIRGSIADGVAYRIGWNNPNKSEDPSTGLFFGAEGDPYGSGMPPPPSGTAGEHTRILGANYASCRAPTAKTQLHGGFGASTVINMAGASYVDLACLDITDFSSCGRASQTNECNSSVGALSDYATSGITWSRASTHDTLTDVHIHGLAGNGMYGPTGTGMVFSYIELLGNAGSGWNADAGDKTTGTGTLQVDHYEISWNGCAEEYPIVHPVPYGDCTDDNHGGYGDGFGTATVDSQPAWNVSFDQGIASNNTQDGLDALHIGGSGSSMTVSHTLAYGNMGQQIKVGGAHGIITDNQIVTNCNALRQAIPGTPPGFNTKLSDFCRAADAGVLVTVNNDVPLQFEGNTILSASSSAIEIECAVETCTSAAKIDFRNNILIGFRNDAAHGYVAGGGGDFSNPIYVGPSINPFTNAGSVYSDNVTYHPNREWVCPAKGERRAHCGDPHLADESWHMYGYGDMARGAAPQASAGEGTADSEGTGEDRRFASYRLSRMRTAEGLGAGVLFFAAWQLLRRPRRRG